MFNEAHKLVCRGGPFIGLFAFLSFSVQAQETGEKPLEDELGVEYIAQVAEISKYMAYMVGTYERPGIKDEDIAAITDFEMIYAFQRGKQGKSSTRFERTGRKILSDGYGDNYDERRLKNWEHDWIQNGNFRRQIYDYKREHEKQMVEFKRLLDPNSSSLPLYNPEPEFLDPLFLPLGGANIWLGAEGMTFNHPMPVGQLHDSASLGDGVTLGVWIVGEYKEYANIILFDRKQGGVPIHYSSRMKKPRVPPLDKCDPIKNSDPFDNTKTKWKKHEKSGYWLPTEIESAEVHRYHRASYDMKIYWWINDEVPDEIFELEDFKKAVIRRSKAHEMIETLKDSLDK
ncbi:MAG: hypothetical protein ACK5E3_09215 [Planctomycetota bacterium]|jgi:hypothetical protein